MHGSLTTARWTVQLVHHDYASPIDASSSLSRLLSHPADEACLAAGTVENHSGHGAQTRQEVPCTLTELLVAGYFLGVKPRVIPVAAIEVCSRGVEPACGPHARVRRDLIGPPTDQSPLPFVGHP